MRLLSRLLGGWRALIRRDRVEQDLDEELREYVETAAAQKVAQGMRREDALRAVRAEVGSVEAVKDRVRDVGWESIAYSVWQDIRFALRMMRRKPAFTAAAVVTLALGIGGTTAVFSVVDAFFLRAPTGVTDGASLRRIYIKRDAGSMQTPDGYAGSWADYTAMREGPPAFAGVAAYLWPALVDLGRGAAAEQVRVGAVSHNFMEVLGVAAAHGRFFLPEEDGVPGAHPVALISHALWRSRFGGLPDVLDKTLLLNGVVVEIIGVTGEGFAGIEPDAVDVWLPSAMATTVGIRTADERGDWRLHGRGTFALYVARLSTTVDEARALAAASGVLRHAAEAEPRMDPTPEVVSASMVLASVRGDKRAMNLSLWLTIAAAFVLVIACANVANLLLGRGITRRRELAVRLSLGAGRWRIIRQHLTESAVLALVGGAGGVLFAAWATRLMDQFPLPRAAGQIDARLLTFACVLSLLTGLVFGILPALRSVHVDPAGALKDVRTAGTFAGTVTRRALVVAQISLSLALLIGAMLFIRSMQKISAIDGGVDLDRLLVATVELKANAFTPEAREAFYNLAVSRLLQLPVVERASTVHYLPLTGWAFQMPFRRPDGRQDESASARINLVGAGYFETVGGRLLRGRTINADDTRGRELVAVVNEKLARALVDDGNPIGLCVGFHPELFRGGCTLIVGIVETDRYGYISGETVPMVYKARAQAPDAIPFATPSIIVRTHGRPADAAAAVRAALQGLRSDMPFVLVRPLADDLRADLLPYRLGAMLFSMFGVLALVLAAVGLYGVLGYFVTERTTEIGIRRSLGAPARAVIGLVLRQGLIPVAVGIVIGLGVAFAGTRFLASLLFGIEARDPISFALAATFLMSVALLAILVPACRAARVDPLIALRHE